MTLPAEDEGIELFTTYRYGSSDRHCIPQAQIFLKLKGAGHPKASPSSSNSRPSNVMLDIEKLLNIDNLSTDIIILC